MRLKTGRSSWRIAGMNILRIVRVVLACLLGLVYCHLAQAQEKDKTKYLQFREDDISTIRNDMKTLESEQQQIIDQLSELKKLLVSSSTGAPAQPPLPPTTLDVHGEAFRGSNSARVAIIEYADFECPYCGQYARQIYPQILENYINTGKVKYFYRDLPLSMHPHALVAARAARCAGEQGKYWEIHDDLFSNQSALGLNEISARAQELGVDGGKLSECLSSDRYAQNIHKSMSEAQTLGIEGTPTFFMGKIDGDTVKIDKAIKGASAFAIFKSFLDALLGSKEQAAASPN